MSQKLELSPAEIAEANGGIRAEELTATQVQALTRAMDSSKEKWKHLKLKGKLAEYREAVKKENEMLFFNYPSLFEMHIIDRLDSTFFEMLQLKRKIEKGEITMEEANAQVGQRLYNRFVPQSLSAPPTMKYEDFYKA
jgi:plasmid maintenance system antidote protein VapI